MVIPNDALFTGEQMMPFRTFLMIFATILTVAGAGPALATDQAARQEPEKTGELPLKSDNPYLVKLDLRSKEFAQKLGGEELKHLYHVRESFGATQAVKIVRRDVLAAVKACSKANPGLKKPMGERFASWAASVDPVVQNKEAEIESAITAQTYTKPGEIRNYLKLIEQTADYANKQIDKQIVTTPEACESLMKSMDKPEKVVTDLVADMTLAPWPPKPEPDGARKKATVPN